MKKTNALRQLDAQKIKYEIKEYHFQDEHDSLEVLRQVHLEASMVFKTIVLKGDKTGYLVCCLPVLEEIDLKQLAKLSHDKKIEPLPQKDLQSITGYVRGGCSPLGMRKKFPTYIHASILSLETVAVSAGQKGMQVLLNPQDLIHLCDALVGNVIKK